MTSNHDKQSPVIKVRRWFVLNFSLLSNMKLIPRKHVQ